MSSARAEVSPMLPPTVPTNRSRMEALPPFFSTARGVAPDMASMVALETVTNQYLGGDTSLACSNETAAKIDRAVVALVKEAHDKAYRILQENRDKLDEIAAHLLEKETITGQEFMDILNGGVEE